MTLNGIFSQKIKGVLMAASVLAIAGFLSRVLGFIRNALLAYFFGAGDVLDAYFLAFRLPDFFFNLLLFGAFSAGFVPVFIKLKQQDSKKAWQITNNILNIALIVFALFGAVFFIAAPWLLKLIAPGFEGEKMALAVRLSRIMFLQPVFLGVSVVFSGILQSTQRFLSYALAPIFYNVGIIFGILVLNPRFGPIGLAWGVVLGAFLHMLVQYPAAKASGFKYRPVFSLKESAIKRIIHIIVPRSLSLILNQLNLVIMAGLASFLGSGRVSIFNFANDINSLILGVVAIPLGVAVFPVFSQFALKDKLEELSAIIIKTLRQLLFLMIPSTALFFVLRAQIVRLTLGYGKFDWIDTVLTIDTLGLFLAGLIFQGVLAIILRAFFALEDAKTPFLVLFFGILVSLAVSIFLGPVMDVGALALAMSAGAVFNAIALSYILERRLKHLDFSELLRPIFYLIVSSAVASTAAYGALHFAVRYLNTHKVLHLVIQGGVAGSVGILVFMGMSALLGIEEARQIGSKLKFKGKINLPSLDEERHK